MVRSLKIRLQRLEEHTIKDIIPIVWLTFLENGEYEVRVPEYRKGDKEVVMKFKTEKEAWDYIETTVGACIVWDIPPQERSSSLTTKEIEEKPKWLKKVDLNWSEANRMMKVAKELPNYSTLNNLGSTALNLLAFRQNNYQIVQR